MFETVSSFNISVCCTNDEQEGLKQKQRERQREKPRKFKETGVGGGEGERERKMKGNDKRGESRAHPNAVRLLRQLADD